MTKHLIHSVGHTPALTNSAAMLSVPSDFSIFIALTAASTFSRRIERGF